MNPFVASLVACGLSVVSLTGCNRALTASDPTAALHRPAAPRDRFAEFLRSGAPFWWSRGGRCESWHFDVDRVSHLDEEEDGRVLRRWYRVEPRGDQVELTGEDVELVRLPGPPTGLEEGGGYGYRCP